MKKRVLLGMSGGVDSSVAAYILQKKGYEVVGATMKLWLPENTENTAIIDAKKIASQLGVEHHIIDLENSFKNTVVKHFIDTYHEGKTPNPCVFCNKHIKFDLMFKVADDLKCDYIATGHYAKIRKNEVENRYELLKNEESNKDQSYMMYNLNQEKLSRILFPIGEFSNKDEVRQVAKEIGLEVFNKPDSQDICFIPDGDYEAFLKKYSNKNPKPGKFIDINGRKIGEHKGIVNYTIGQRKGLGIALGERTYVVDINGKDNTVTLGRDEDLFRNYLIAKDVNFLDYDYDDLKESIEIMAKIRYSSKPCRAIVSPLGNGNVKVEFEQPQRAITSGQSVVFYDGDRLLGGGVIV